MDGMNEAAERLRRCKLFGGNETELRVYGGKWGVPNDRDKNEIVRGYFAQVVRAERLMGQVFKTWDPPLITGSERPQDIAQTSAMIAIAFIMGREFMSSELTNTQRAAIDSGLKLFNQVLNQEGKTEATID